MIVRMKFGRDNGQLRDVDPEAALGMLADGRAELPFIEYPVEVEVTAEYEEDQHRKRTRKKGA
jgi:hypothetical protein